MKDKISVCWITNTPSPYKVDFMNILGERLDLYVLFEKTTESDREKNWYKQDFHSFTAVFLSKDNAKKELRKAVENCDVLINSDYTKAVCRRAVTMFKKAGKPCLLQADGGLAIPRGPIDRVIRYVMKQNDWFLSSGSETDKYFAYYGVPEEKMLHYHFACMGEDRIRENLSYSASKYELRKTMGLREEKILFSVGQQIKRKGYDVLVEAMVGLGPEVGLYIAGGEPEEKVKEIIRTHHLNNIHFLGFLNEEQLRPYYAAADAFVLATRYDIWGLVINEAMSFGLPIISTEKCVAAVQFAKDAKNAELVPVENVEELRKAMKRVLSDAELQSSMSRGSAALIPNYSYERMADDFVCAIKKVSEGKK